MIGTTKVLPLQIGGVPRVNLLPPEVLQSARMRSRRRGLIALVVLVAVIVGACYAGASLYAGAAQAELQLAQARTSELLTERLEYSEATAVANLVAATTEARGLGMSTEVIWADVFDELRLLLPEGTSIASITLAGSAPWEPALLPAGALRNPRVATATVVVFSPTISDAVEWSRRLATVTGFADATSSLVKFDTASGGYFTTVVVDLDGLVLAGRFLADGQEAGE